MMNVLIFHPTLLPPENYGGVERVVLWLARGLLERGHRVTVAALEGSKLPDGITLLPVSRNETSDEILIRRLPPGTDVVHFMAPPTAKTLDHLQCASLLTVHGNGKPGEIFPLNTVFLSSDHARRHGGDTFVYNGIDPSEYEFSAVKRSNFLFLSKTSWRVKNLRGAMRMARLAQVPLTVAGGDRPWSLRIRALVQSQCRWEGSVSGELKRRLLSEARALLFPILWPEPFGLVMAEAWMSGTPVIAHPRGSTREMVLPGVGILAESENEWVEAIRSGLGQIRPEACRKYAETHFHYLKMAENYESVYRKVIAGEKLNSKAPVSVGWELK